ncbi:hypothetical protein GCM10027261_18940 [Geodermatophilus arenarius]|uniref:Uncharacterized protein n=1 Tax=Geodermatophilus arenarius TaxID=1137990 RepID=A0ABV9LJ05_9ACTN
MSAPQGPVRPGEWRPDVPAAARRRHLWHRFRWVGEDSFSGVSLYACRCGRVRPGL